MKKGDIVKKILGASDNGLLGIIVDILCYHSGPKSNNSSYNYAIVNTASGVRRWYCSRLEIVYEMDS